MATAANDPESIKRLRDTISDIANSANPGLAGLRPRLWVDRSFSLDGAGRIVTGTLTGGPLTVGESIDLVSNSTGRAQTSFRVRGLHRFGTAIEQVGPGVRVGVNLTGPKEVPVRGDALAHADQWSNAQRLHVSLYLPPGQDLPAPKGSYRIFVGTAHRTGHLRYPTDAVGQPDGIVLARLHLTQPLGPIAPGDRFVMRDDGAGTTVGGGIVLACDGHPTRYRPQVLLARHQALTRTGTDPTIERARSPVSALGAVLLAERDGAWPIDEFRRLAGTTGLDGARVVGSSIVDDDALKTRSEALHEQLARVPDGVHEPDDLLGRAAVDLLIDTGAASRHGHRVVADSVNLHEQGLLRTAPRALAALDAAVPPLLTRDEFRDRVGIGGRHLVDLAARGVLVEVSPFWTTPERLDKWCAIVSATIGFTENGATTSELREALGLSRKYTIALLEWCDTQRITVRHDNARRLS